MIQSCTNNFKSILCYYDYFMGRLRQVGFGFFWNPNGIRKGV